MTVELATQPWGDEFGMCVDRFGTSWLVNIAGAGRPTRPRRARRSGCPSVPQVGDAAAGGSPLALEPSHRPLGPAIDHAKTAPQVCSHRHDRRHERALRLLPQFRS